MKLTDVFTLFVVVVATLLYSIDPSFIFRGVVSNINETDFISPANGNNGMDTMGQDTTDTMGQMLLFLKEQSIKACWEDAHGTYKATADISLMTKHLIHCVQLNASCNFKEFTKATEDTKEFTKTLTLPSNSSFWCGIVLLWHLGLSLLILALMAVVKYQYQFTKHVFGFGPLPTLPDGVPVPVRHALPPLRHPAPLPVPYPAPLPAPLCAPFPPHLFPPPLPPSGGLDDSF